ncbi:SH3 domain-containing protein [Mariprofundus sp. EBB-1]|uniref:SH3 domain-containing protein n=1 Tax=Mariprofundus sp. EBB-1 TaxID=2650971 RepID=UPI000EF2753D|nr:SH3 domain-containing protein [Mariprofundus sp. EBB-1]RLL51064.1 SH3 domain-containing protein [Mariprofundus sp. EBB-1]
MKITRLMIAAAALFTVCALADGIYPAFAPVSVANAEAEGPALKLIKSAKLHVAASGPSHVSEIVYQDDVVIWLDKVDVWVQVRVKKNGHVGWIHHSYLKAAVSTSSAPAKASTVNEQGIL